MKEGGRNVFQNLIHKISKNAPWHFRKLICGLYLKVSSTKTQPLLDKTSKIPPHNTRTQNRFMGLKEDTCKRKSANGQLSSGLLSR
jgi:hypothetical protein